MIEIDGSESIEGFTFHSTPGHSIAHASIVFQSGEQRALFAGGVLHCTLEVYKPDWNTVFDAFPQGARESRMWALKFAADHEAMLFSSHLPASSAPIHKGEHLRKCPRLSTA